MATHRRSTSHVVIPARLASTRLPEKLLLRETGKPLIQHTYEAACRAKRPSGISIAVDSTKMAREVLQFGGDVHLTDPRAASGTDRVAEVAAKLDAVDVVVNLQGDEPELAGKAIDLAIEVLDANPDAVMSTLATPIRRREQLHDHACVKVVMDSRRRAIYFSRFPIPFVRDGDIEAMIDKEPPVFHQHIGLYAYRREFLLRLRRIPSSPLEQAECLEQLRVLSAGYTIQIALIDEPAFGIDTREDYRAFVDRMKQRKSA